MAQYVVHKIGFFYTDESFEVGEVKGTVMGITKSLEEAQAIKKREDIKSMKNVGGFESEDFLFGHPNAESINQKLEEYITSEFKTTEEGNYSTYLLPKEITDQQAEKLMSIMELSFHNIVVYGDDEVINPGEYEFKANDEVSGF